MKTNPELSIGLIGIDPAAASGLEPTLNSIGIPSQTILTDADTAPEEILGGDSWLRAESNLGFIGFIIEASSNSPERIQALEATFDKAGKLPFFVVTAVAQQGLSAYREDYFCVPHEELYSSGLKAILAYAELHDALQGDNPTLIDRLMDNPTAPSSDGLSWRHAWESVRNALGAPAESRSDHTGL